jgi:hypothetical protein
MTKKIGRFLNAQGDEVSIRRDEHGRFSQTLKNKKWNRNRKNNYTISIILEAVKEDMKALRYDVCKELLAPVFTSVLDQLKGTLVDLETNNSNRIIVTVSIPTTISPSEVVNPLKSASSRKMKEQEIIDKFNLSREICKISNENRGKGYGTPFWAGSYRCMECDEKLSDKFVSIF